MYIPHTSVSSNSAYNVKRYADAVLKKARDSASTVVKIVAYMLILNVLIACGLSAIVTVSILNQKNAENKIDELHLQNQNSNISTTVEFGKLLKQLDAMLEKQANSSNHMNVLEDKLTNLTSQIDVQAETSRALQKQLSQTLQRVYIVRDKQDAADRQLEELKENQENQNNSVPLIAFTVSQPRKTLADATPIFDIITLNEGGGYDPQTGKFICPLQGVYLITFTIVRKPYNESVECQLYQDSTFITTASIQAFSIGSSVSTFLHLSVGDVVDLVCSSRLTQGVFLASEATVYSGALITADLRSTKEEPLG